MSLRTCGESGASARTFGYADVTNNGVRVVINQYVVQEIRVIAVMRMVVMRQKEADPRCSRAQQAVRVVIKRRQALQPPRIVKPYARNGTRYRSELLFNRNNDEGTIVRQSVHQPIAVSSSGITVNRWWRCPH